MTEYTPMTDLIPLSLAMATLSIEDDRQKEIMLVRNYFDGDQGVELTERLKQFLGSENRDGPDFRVNLTKAIVDIVLEKLRVKSFDCVDIDQAATAWEWWNKNHLDAYQEEVHEAALRDGEAFIIVDWDAEKNHPLMIVNPRYISVENEGDGFGCWMAYPDNDPTQPPILAVKQWIEKTTRSQTVHRNIYHPDRIEKYIQGGARADWTLVETVDWRDPAAEEPIGIPVIPFQTRGLRSVIWDALPMQDMVNKSTLDLVATLDMTAFRIFYALGFIPTDDGKEPADDQSNWLKVAPGQIVGTTKSREEVAFGAIDASDPRPLINACHQFMLWMALLSGTPSSRFTTSAEVASNETLKEQENPLVAKTKSHQTRFGNSWEHVMEIARKVSNVFGGTNMNEEVMFETLWADPGTQSEAERVEMLVMKRELGVPLTQLWSEAGYSKQQIEEMKKTEEYARMLAAMGPEPKTTGTSNTTSEEAGDGTRIEVEEGS